MSTGLLLSGCGKSKPEATPAPATDNKPAGPKLANPGENMVAAVPAGKSSRYLGVYFSLGNSPAINQALPVDIAVIPHQDYISVSGRFESQDGITVISGDTLPLKKDAGSEQPIKHQLVLMPVRAGVFMITATMDTEGAEGAVSRVFSIPVIVAEPAPAAGAAPASSPPPAVEKPDAN